MKDISKIDPKHNIIIKGAKLHNLKNVERTEKDAKRIFPKEKWNELHLRIIFYGREYCPARGWDINNDIITKTIGRKSIINKLIK